MSTVKWSKWTLITGKGKCKWCDGAIMARKSDPLSFDIKHVDPKNDKHIAVATSMRDIINTYYEFPD